MEIREFLKDFKPYEWELSNEQISTKTGLSVNRIIRFDTNTSPYPPTEVLNKLSSILLKLKVNEYPDTSYTEIRNYLSEYTNIDRDQIVLTNGADEALDIIAKVFIDNGTNALISAPTYSMYRVCVEILNGEIIPIFRSEDFSDNVDKIIESFSEKTRVVFLCSPNNPTGNISKRKAIIRLLEELKCPIVIDESYFEFSKKTVADLISKYQNLVIVRTFSKAFGLAGARIGYILSSKELCNLFNKVRPPNSVSIISFALAKLALESLDVMEKNVKEIIKERERISRDLMKTNKIHVYPSEANFILIKFLNVDALKIHKELLNRGIVTRNVSNMPMLKNCLRITIRTYDENNILLNNIYEILKMYA
ncbi:MAG: histidinol-phosphate transaminase [Candidatus Bathyarchaeia archaeon]